MTDAAAAAAATGELPPLQAFWALLTDSMSTYTLMTSFFWFILAFFYMVFSLFYYVLDKTRIAHRWKVQKERYPDDALYWRSIKRLTWMYCLIVYPLSHAGILIFHVLDIDLSVEGVPPMWEIAAHVLVYLIIEDFVHYLFHRALHWPWLYKNIHKVHHHHAYPFGLTASYSHPIEMLLLGIPTYAGPVIFRPHFLVWMVWMVWRQLDAVDTHCGYDFPFHPSRFIPLYGGTPFHDAHHHNFIGNYGSRFTLWDILFGTYREFVSKEEVLAEYGEEEGDSYGTGDSSYTKLKEKEQ